MYCNLYGSGSKGFLKAFLRNNGRMKDPSPPSVDPLIPCLNWKRLEMPALSCVHT